jgi:RNA polymerase sigma factor (sigma-70 family)
MKVLNLMSEGFELFLNWLDLDREAAGQRYEAIRRRLSAFFELRGCAQAEDLADETIDIVIRKVPTFNESYEGDPVPYFYRVAHYVYLNYRETQAKREDELPSENLADPTQPHALQEKELRHLCLERCLRKLSPERRELLLQYYGKDKRAKIEQRKGLAQQLGDTANALRLRLHRLRGEMRDCVTDCLESITTH